MYNTKEAAKKLDVSSATLSKFVQNHPDLRPQLRVGRSMIWTEEEVQALRDHGVGKSKRYRYCPACGETGVERFLSIKRRGPSLCLPCLAKARGFVLRKAPAARKSKKQKS